uniref:Uncharacterized protein n=1 Tax=Arundo donax TaxID=35708 RepID=A0A0A9CXE5_ARUDO
MQKFRSWLPSCGLTNSGTNPTISIANHMVAETERITHKFYLLLTNISVLKHLMLGIREDKPISLPLRTIIVTSSTPPSNPRSPNR